MTDACWQKAPKAEGFTDKFTGLAPADPTKAWVCYDDKSIYVAFHAFDAQPDEIVARETKEETLLRGEDTVTVTLDPFHTHQRTDRSSFTVNARGVHFAEIGAGRAVKTEWKGEWQSAARIATNGWTVELAIPWAMLNYPRSKKPLNLGLNFSRAQERTKVVSLWSNIGLQEFYELDGHWEGVEPPVEFKPQFSYLPYALVQAGAATRASAGLDVRAALTPSLTGVFTANPDFSTVERAVEGIDFSYGERFVPDRRPFFLEGEKFYAERTLLGSFFHSPRIPDFDTGLNVYGRVAPRTSLGVLGAFDVDQRSDFVLRGRQELSETDSVDVSIIGREGPEDQNEVFVLKPALRRGPWFLTSHWVPSLVNRELAGDALNVDFSYRGNRFWFGNTYHYVRPDFRDDNGFIPFTDFHGNFSWLRYENEWREGAVRRLVWLAFMNNADHFEGRLFRRQPAFLLNAETRGDYGLSLRWEGGRFEQYDDSVFSMDLRARVSDKFHNFGLGVQFGRQKGEDLTFLTPAFTWRFGERFTVGVASSFLAHLENRQQHILTVTYDLTKAKSIGARLVQLDGHTSAFVSFRRSGYVGMDYYLIFGDPDPTKTFTPQLIVKVVKPF